MGEITKENEMEESEVFTQEQINESFIEIKAEWDKLVKESGRSESMFLAMGGEIVSHFLYNYQVAKEHVESQGLVMPALVKGLSVSVSQKENKK